MAEVGVVQRGVMSVLRKQAIVIALLDDPSLVHHDDTPADFKRNARRFLYYRLFRTSLPFGNFLEPSVRTTQTRLKSFERKALLESDAVTVVLDGILNDRDFLLPE